MTQISLRGMLMVAVSTAALTACTSQTTETNLTTALSTANATIATQTTDLATANATIAARNATISEKNTEIAAKQATIDARDATIVQKNAEIATKNGLIATTNGDVSDLEDEVAALEDEVAALEVEVAGLESDIIDLVSDIADLEDEVAGLEAEKAGLQSQVTNYNKTAFNANRGNTDAEDGGYVRDVGVLALQPERADIAAAQSAVTVKQAAKANAQTNYNTAATAATNIGNTRAAAQAIEPDVVSFNGQSLAIFKAADTDGAALYAEVMGLDITDANDLASLVSAINFSNVGIVNLTTEFNNANDAANNANDALNDAIADLDTAEDALSDANDALTAAIAGQKGTAGAVRLAQNSLSSAVSGLMTAYANEGVASGNQSAAQGAYDEASAFVVDPAYDGVSIATYFADLQSDAEFYAEILGLDLTDSAVQGQLVSAADYASAVNDLNTALTTAKTARTNASSQVVSAQTGVTNAENALETAIANYHADRAPQQSSTMTLYRADGRAVSASGAMVYKQSLGDNLQHGQALQEAGRLTALFLVDGNGDPTEVLVFEASMVGESSVGTPFTLPPGAATFESSSMVAAFAQLEGAENGINTYTLDGDTDAGSLTINFNTKTGTLVVDGLVNGANQDFSVNANLTFDPINGTFSATAVNQAYTSDTTGLAEVATGNIVGELSAVADAFTAYIDTTDKTGINEVNVKIMTRIVGTGAVTLAP